jgi:hypothetical protein
MFTENVTQDRQLKWLVQNLCGPCIESAVCTISNVVGGSPGRAYEHWYVSGDDSGRLQCRFRGFPFGIVLAKS